MLPHIHNHHCICANHDRLGFYAEIQIIFGTVYQRACFSLLCSNIGIDRYGLHSTVCHFHVIFQCNYSMLLMLLFHVIFQCYYFILFFNVIIPCYFPMLLFHVYFFLLRLVMAGARRERELLTRELYRRLLGLRHGDTKNEMN